MVSVAVCVHCVHAGDVVKTNNTVNLNLGTSWVGGNAPTSSDVAVWNATVTGANTVLLGADLDWSGLRVDNPGGTVTVNAGNKLTLGTGGITITGGRSLTLNNDLALSADQTWNLTNTLALASSMNVSGTGRTLTVAGSGAALLMGSFSKFSGVINENGSDLRVTSFAGTNITVNVTSVQASPWFCGYGIVGTVEVGDLTTANTGAILGGIAQNGAVTYKVGALGNSSTWAGMITNGASVTTTLNKVGVGVWTLSGTNYYTGATTVDAGALRIMTPRGLDSSSSVVVNCTNGLRFGSAVAAVTLKNLSSSAAGLIALTNESGTAVALTVTNSADTTYSGTLTGSGSLVKTGTNKLTLASANSFTGGVTLAAGTLMLGNTNALGTGTLRGGGGTLDFTAQSMTTTNRITLDADLTIRLPYNTIFQSAFSAASDKTLTFDAVTYTHGGANLFNANFSSFNGTFVYDKSDTAANCERQNETVVNVAI